MESKRVSLLRDALTLLRRHKDITRERSRLARDGADHRRWGQFSWNSVQNERHEDKTRIQHDRVRVQKGNPGSTGRSS